MRLFVTSPRGKSHMVLSGQQYLPAVSFATRSTMGFAPVGFSLPSAAVSLYRAQKQASAPKILKMYNVLKA